jgi:signal transduction histidine kinase
MFNLINLILTILIIGFICSLGYLAMGNDKQNPANRFFFFFTIALALWEFFSFLESLSFGGPKLMQVMLLLDFFLAPYVIFLISLFTFNFPRENKRINENFVFLLAPIMLISGLSLSGLIINNIAIGPDGIEFQFGKLFFIYAAVLITYIVFDLINLIYKYFHSLKSERKRAAQVLFGFILILAITTSVNLFLQNRISNQCFRVFNLIFPASFVLFTFQAIVLYNIMKIKIIMRRSLVYFLVIISILVPAGIWLYLARMIVPNQIILVSLIILALSLTAVSRLKKDYYRFANKYFFSALYDTRELIYTLNSALHASLDTKKICQTVAHILTQAFHPQAIASLTYAFDDEKWRVINNDNFLIKKEDVAQLDPQALAKLFHGNHPLVIKSKKEQEIKDSIILKYFKKLKVALAIPIKMKGRLTGILIFADKETKDEYRNDDLKVLTTVGMEISLAMENILLYEKEKRFNYKLRAEITKATRQLQEQNQELQRLDAAKDEFVSIVSHQLRTPLTGIRWFTNLLLGNKKKNLNKEQLDFLEQINTSNKKMIQLVNDLLDVSHIETGYKFKITKEDCLVFPIIQDILKENIMLIKTKGLKIKNHIPKNLKIKADRVKIRQVWQNLLSNATNYSPRGKEITIAVEKEKDGPVFSVKDEGIGIPKKQQNRLFEKFFRAKNAALQDPNGTGLGLYITRGIIHGHGGDIWFKSAENKGTTFFFSIPNKNNATRKYKITKAKV